MHQRDDDRSEPVEFVTDVVCSCAVVFASAVHSSATEALDDALDQHAGHRSKV